MITFIIIYILLLQYDIIIIPSVIYDIRIIIMLTCPNCSKPKSSSSTTLTFSIDLNTGQMSSETNKYAKYENILKDSNKSFMFFNSAIMETCKSCKNDYYMTFYYDNKDKKCNGLVFNLEDFQEITTQYYVNSNLDNYLPNANLKRTYAEKIL